MNVDILITVLYKYKYRVYKFKSKIMKQTKGSKFKIYDWLAPDNGVWGKLLKTMIEVENLTLVPTTRSEYKEILGKVGFNEIYISEHNNKFAKANLEIVEHLQSSAIKSFFGDNFNEKLRGELIEGHQQIAESMNKNELLAAYVTASK